jgi:D-aminoacyl-tRNA deacylase
MIAIAVSRADEASTHIREHLLDLRAWTERDDQTRADGDGGGTVYRHGPFELRTFDDLHLYLDGVAGAFDGDPEFLVFPSRHAGDTGELLTAHFTGNFGPAEYGGDDYDLAAACPAAHRAVYHALREVAPDDYEVGMECTHHGPTDVGAPSMFVEIGSAQRQWRDPAAAEAAARAILALDDADARTDRTLVGFGGGHYVPRFERVVRETDWAMGHIAADWSLSEMGLPERRTPVVEAAFEQSGAELALLEGDHPKLRRIVEDVGYRVVDETWVRAVDGVDLALVEALETAVCTVPDGLRFGDAATDHEGEWVVVDLSPELLAEAQGVDEDAAREAVRSTTLAYETTQNGTRLAPRIVVAEEADREAVVRALLDVLRSDYDAVERDGDAVVLSETAFDPALAADHGVPEGPKFGQLAAGRPVDVDGETVAPEDVHAERTRRIPI